MFYLILESKLTLAVVHIRGTMKQFSQSQALLKQICSYHKLWHSSVFILFHFVSTLKVNFFLKWTHGLFMHFKQFYTKLLLLSYPFYWYKTGTAVCFQCKSIAFKNGPNIWNKESLEVFIVVVIIFVSLINISHSKMRTTLISKLHKRSQGTLAKPCTTQEQLNRTK